MSLVLAVSRCFWLLHASRPTYAWAGRKARILFSLTQSDVTQSPNWYVKRIQQVILLSLKRRPAIERLRASLCFKHKTFQKNLRLISIKLFCLSGHAMPEAWTQNNREKSTDKQWNFDTISLKRTTADWGINRKRILDQSWLFLLMKNADHNFFVKWRNGNLRKTEE